MPSPEAVSTSPHHLVTGATLAAALGCALIAGVCFAFSSFVMPGLARLPPAQGVAAMQAINAAALHRTFMIALFGTAAACLVLAVASIATWSTPGARLRLAGAALYLVGMIGLTAIYHVPRNQHLAATPADSAQAAALWARYLVDWTAWNHVRAAAALAAAAALVLSLLGARPRGL